MVSETKTLKSLKTILFLSCIIQSRFSSTSYSKRKEKCRFCFDPLCSFRETAHIRRIPVARVQSVSAATRNYSSRLLWRVRVVERVIEEEEEEESYARIERAKKRSRRRRSRIENPRATAQRLPRARNNNRATFAGTTPVAASFRMPCMIGRDEPCPQMLHLLSSATVFVGDGSFHFPPEQAIFESVETGCWESGDFPISTGSSVRFDEGIAKGNAGGILKRGSCPLPYDLFEAEIQPTDRFSGENVRRSTAAFIYLFFRVIFIVRTDENKIRRYKFPGKGARCTIIFQYSRRVNGVSRGEWSSRVDLRQWRDVMEKRRKKTKRDRIDLKPIHHPVVSKAWSRMNSNRHFLTQNLCNPANVWKIAAGRNYKATSGTCGHFLSCD